MAKDPFKALRPTEEKVAVGGDTLLLRTATLDQEQAIMEAISELDLGALFGPLSEMLSSDNETNTAAILRRMGALGPQLWAAAQKVLGRQLAPALRDACIAVLHTEGNAELLKKADKIGHEGSFDSDGVYSCPGLKAFVRQNLTLLQATEILHKAWTLNSYSAAVGKLVPLLQEMPEAPLEPGATTQQAVS